MLQRDRREEPLRRKLAAGALAFAPGLGAQHLDPDLIARHAAGELGGEQALAVAVHLATCEGGVCPALFGEEAAAIEGARRALYDAPIERPSRIDVRPGAPRTFQCREALWEEFEGMAGEIGCRIDELINEAMEEHLRVLGYGEGAPLPPPDARSPTVRPPAMAAPTAPPTPPARSRPVPPPQRPPAPPPGFAAPPPARAHAPPPARAQASQALQVPQTPAPSAWPAPLPAAAAPPPAAAPASTAPALFIVYGGERVQVTKDRFVIGRSRQSSDLSIKDPNISRQHAMIELTGGRYYIVDMGSTNGVLFDGDPVNRKQIQEGDRFLIGEHEIVLTYRS
ncbi:MAG TPA: FHA domain-containing protein [Bacilli bacterium]|nr:FHA domain-containing protein [Bacilli bacterium]